MSTVTSELISFFLHAERAQCTFCKQEDDWWPAAMEGKGIYLRRRSRMAELTVTVAVLGGDDVETQWQQRRFFSTVQWHQSAFPSPLVYPFCSFPLFSPSVSLNFPSRYSPFFVFLSFGRLCLYPVGFSLSVSLLFLQNKNTSSSPSLSSFFLLLLSCTPSVFIGRGSEGHPALPSHGRAWWQHGGRLLHSRPCLCTLQGMALLAWGRGGVSEGTSRGVGFLGFGREIKDKKLEGKCFFFPYSLRVQGKKKAYGAVQNGTVCFPFFFLWQWNAWNGAVLTKTRRFI